MLNRIHKLVAKLNRDERGSVSIETVGMIALGCVVLFALGNMVGTGTDAGGNTNTLIGTMFDFSKKVLINWSWK
jgi:Flp pilus assembly pilin Flp